MTYLYRYRSAEAVLGDFEELEKQEIYFSTVDKLNDPMEGYKDLFWSGDGIVWRALLKHYVFCLLETTYEAFFRGLEFDVKYVENIVLSTPSIRSDKPIAASYERLSANFLASPAVKAFLSLAVSREVPIRRSELTQHLRALHPLILTPIFNELHNQGLWPGFVQAPEDQQEKTSKEVVQFFESTAILQKEYGSQPNTLESYFAATNSTWNQTQLIAEFNVTERTKKAPLIFLSGKFTEAYISALDRLVHNDWYVACFTKRPDNHSMWSTYADGHRGICLMFRATPNDSGALSLQIERVTGASASKSAPTTYQKSFVPHAAQPVKYATDYPSIDFFRSLGTIRQSDMNNFWYMGEDGKFSSCRDAVYSDEEAWRTAYWETFATNAHCKTPEWEHEEEYRVVVQSFFDMRDKEKRKLKYRFGDLAGIVFGMKTATETKLRVMKIIEQKCIKEERSDFKFFEVRYTPSNRFEVHELSLLKIRPS